MAGMMQPIPSLYPGNTGWTYVDESTGTKLHGGNRLDLIQRVRAWRELNQFPVGDPEADVDAYICRFNAKICGGRTARPAVASEKRAQVADRVRSWLGRLVATRSFVRVSPAEAVQRAAVCRSCPFNVEYSSGCGSCNAAALKVRGALLKGAPEGSIANLAGCHRYGWDNAVAVQMSHGPDSTAPEGCWRASS